MKYLIFILLSLPAFADLGSGGGADLNEAEAHAQSRKGMTAGGVAGGGDTIPDKGDWKSKPQTGAEENTPGGIQKDSSKGEVMFIPERHRLRRERTR